MVSEADDDRRAAGRALLMQFVDAGDADIGSGGGVDAGSRGPHQRQPHRVATQQYQAHFGLVYLDLEPEHLTQERGSGRKIVNLQVGPAAQELSHRNMLRLHWSPPHARSADLALWTERGADPQATHNSMIWIWYGDGTSVARPGGRPEDLIVVAGRGLHQDGRVDRHRAGQPPFIGGRAGLGHELVEAGCGGELQGVPGLVRPDGEAVRKSEGQQDEIAGAGGEVLPVAGNASSA
jgi:hypothetical protein